MSRGNGGLLPVLRDGLRELYAQHDLDSLPQAALKLAVQLVGCDIATYNEIDVPRNRILAVVFPETETARVQAVSPAWERYAHQHPLVSHFARRPDDRPHKITDLVPHRKFRQTDFYRTVFQPLGLRYQMVTSMPAAPPLVVGIAQNRARRDFNERDRRRLDLLRPHLRQAYDNARLVTELRLRSRGLEVLLDRIDRGQIVIDDTLRVWHASPAGVRFVSEFLPGETLTPVALPATLQRWARMQVASIRQESDQLLRPSPLMIDGRDGRVTVRMIRDGPPSRFIIVLSRAVRLPSAQPLESMGLTAREAEVLYWCIEGKSRGEIALLLRISDRTVQKHLEHIYGKLEVPNRVAAVTKALEFIHW